MRHASWLTLAIIASSGAAFATGPGRAGFDVPPGRLATVVAGIAAQAHATIAIPDPDLALRPSPGVRGTLPLREALSRALRGTGTTAVFYGPSTIRIVRAAEPRPSAPKALAPRPVPAPEPPGDIIVTASKQRATIDRYPGSVAVVPVDRQWASRHAADGTTALIDLLPSTGATNLGPARNKLFIRGIADSSFNGPTQATVGQYLGDVRLNYNAPDPNLNLYDLERIEVLVGPQGTLYGAGSLGGVIRLVPHAPDPDAFAASMSSGVSTMRDGRLGGDVAGMVNVPLVDDRLAVRLVGFATHQPGYIDAPAQGRRGINATGSVGQRLDLRLAPGTGWTFDLGLVIQNSVSRDGQYTLSEDPALIRDDPITQPFHNTYYLGYFTAKGSIGWADLVSTTSFVRHRLHSVFDATGYDGTSTPARYVGDNGIVLLSHETRMSGGGARSPWVAGVTTTFNSSALTRTLGPVAEDVPISGVVNDQFEAAIFGQMSRPLTSRLTATVGGRLIFSSETGRLVSGEGLLPDREMRNAERFSGTLALDWRLGERLSTFFHYQQGYRAGGLAVAPSGASLTAQRFSPDDLNMDELGLRYGWEGKDPLVIRAAIFAADWNSIQADLVDSKGLPYTANIGRGRITGLDATVTWRIIPSLSVTASAFVNYSNLYAPAPGFGGSGRNPLPNVPANGQRLAAEWHHPIGPDLTLSATASIRYVGRSVLGVAPSLNIPQGGYGLGALSARIDRGRFGFGVDVQNVADVRGNTFAFGNPFGVARRDQITPVRPRTVRLRVHPRSHSDRARRRTRSMMEAA